MPDLEEINGALLIDKPAGPTRHDLVDVVRDIRINQEIDQLIAA